MRKLSARRPELGPEKGEANSTEPELWILAFSAGEAKGIVLRQRGRESGPEGEEIGSVGMLVCADMFDSPTVKIDVSKRSKEDMGFWHRNVDSHEVIFCVRGALRWETEMGTRVLKEGDMMIIPKGITHRSMLCEESLEENVLIELKVRDKLNYVGDNK